MEDDASLRRALAHRLTAEGYQVAAVADGEQGLRRASTERFDLVVLDVMLPGRSGFEICQALRLAGIETPMIMLTALGELSDRLSGLRLGADDYLCKPFEVEELLARMSAQLRRKDRQAAPPPTFRFGTVEVDVRGTEVRRAGCRVELSVKEFRLLCQLIAHRGETLSRNELLDAVWGRYVNPTLRTVDTHVACLRRKLEEDPHQPRHILTIHGRGYRFSE